MATGSRPRHRVHGPIQQTGHLLVRDQSRVLAQGRSLRQGLELGPDDGGMHAWRKGPLGESAVSAHQYIFSPDQAGIGHEAPGDQFGVLDDLGCIGDHAWDEERAVRELDLFPHLPFVLMTRIGGFHSVGARAHLQHDIDNVLQRYIGDMGAMPAPPT
jgi:hypothetical protein